MFNIHDKQCVSHAELHTRLISHLPSLGGSKSDVFISNNSPRPNLDNPYENTPAFDIYSARRRCLGLSARYAQMFNAHDSPISQQRAGI